MIRRTLIAFAAVCCLTGTVFSRAQAETVDIRIARQFGLNYLPLMVMERERLVEKHAAALGIPDVKVTWLQFGGSNSMNDALISEGLDFAAGGVAPVIKIWDRTRAGIGVRGVAALGTMPIYLNTRNPAVRTVADFTDKDKIALPAVRVSIQAILLQMAALKALGNRTALDRLTVSMKHPDAMAALLSGRTEITAHFANPPYQELELKTPGVHRVLSSFDVMGPSSLNCVYTTKKVHDGKPRVYKAVLDALTEAVTFINADKHRAAKIYAEMTKSHVDDGAIERILNDPNFTVTIVPQGIQKYADFMYSAQEIKSKPGVWKDVFFPEMNDEPGS